MAPRGLGSQSPGALSCSEPSFPKQKKNRADREKER